MKKTVGRIAILMVLAMVLSACSAPAEKNEQQPAPIDLSKPEKTENMGNEDALDQVQCEDCGNWYEEGNEFRNHICETPDGAQVQCEDCGNWYEEGNEFRNHICTVG